MESKCLGLTADRASRGRDGARRWRDLERDVCELAVVGARGRIERRRVNGVRVDVEASLVRDDVKVVEGLNEREVVRAHLPETVRALVQERRGGDGVIAGLTVLRAVTRRATRGVVRELSREVTGVVVSRDGRGRELRHRGVLDNPEQGLDRVREANVVRLVRRGADRGRVERATSRALDLLDDHVAGALAHLHTLLVRNDGVVGPELNVREVARWRGTVVDQVVTVRDHEIGDALEVDVNAHLVVGKRGGRERDTGVAAEEERERHVDGGRLECRSAVGQGLDVADHVVVADALRGRDRVGGPDVEPDVIELLNLQVIEGDPAEVDEVVADVLDPASAVRRDVDTAARERRERRTEPDVHEVVTGTRDLPANLLGAKVRLATTVLSERDGHLGEPRALLDAADKVRDRGGTVVEVLLDLVVGREVDEGRRNRVGHGCC